MNRLIRFAWFVLGFNVLTILGGAVVRATGSGAGCGPSWPTCKGQVVPELEGATAIEFTHRMLSGLALILVGVLAFWVWRATSPGSVTRKGALLSVVAIVGEALIGAMIVLAEWVADDASTARVVAVPLHLVNTFFLLTALTLTIYWLKGGSSLDPGRPGRRWVILGAVSLLILAASGGVTALADTLFPVGSNTGENHFLTVLRVVHPILALVILLAAWRLVSATGLPPGRAGRLLPYLVGGLALTGVVNIGLHLPLASRILHLLFADLLWIGFVLVSADYLSRDVRQVAVSAD